MIPGFIVTCDSSTGLKMRQFLPSEAASRHSPLVTSAVDRAAGIAAAMIGALHYREELEARFCASSIGQDSTDIALVLAAYRCGGPQILERLEGEFALVVWDGPKRRLAALRDPFGSWPLYWRVLNSQIALSTSLSALADLRPSRSLDLEYLADFLMFPNPHTELPTERTAFEGVSRVLPGVILEWATTGQIRTRRYWDWAARTEPTSGMTLAESGDKFATIFERAIAERMTRGPIAAHLSGGMDSTSVAAVVRDRIVSTGGGEPLFTLSLVYRRSSLSREREYIEEFLRQGGPLVPNFIAGEGAPDFDWFRGHIPFHDEPYSGLPSFSVHQALIETAANTRASTILTGLGSDELVAWSPSYIADLIQGGRWFTAVKEAKRWSRGLNQSLWTTLREFGCAPLFPTLVQEGIWPRFRGRYGEWSNLGWFSVPPWILSDFSRQYQLRQRGLEHDRRLSRRPTTRSMQLNVLETSAGDWSRWYLASPLGLTVSHPFQDPRLVCFSLQNVQQFRMDPSQRKPVLRAAMRGRLPERILDRKEKRGFDDIYSFGLSSEYESPGEHGPLVRRG